ncbi:hypothetical protein CR513_10854, partial [Mucuna pruriens]
MRFEVVLELSSLKGVLLTRIMKGNANRMDSVLNEEMRRKAQGSSSQSKENKGKNGKSKEKDDDRVTTATGDDLIILRDFKLVIFVFDESMWIIDSSATLHVTSKKEFFTSYTSELEKYSHCMAGKQTRVSFKKHPLSRKSELLELVHSDVYGPLK